MGPGQEKALATGNTEKGKTPGLIKGVRGEVGFGLMAGSVPVNPGREGRNKEWEYYEGSFFFHRALSILKSIK